MIFIAFRIVAWPLWIALTCCCKPGKEYEVQDDFKWSPLSIHYVETELKKLNDMKDFKAGAREIEYAA